MLNIQSINHEMLLLFSWNYIIIFLVKRIYPSKIFLHNPLFNYLYSPGNPWQLPCRGFPFSLSMKIYKACIISVAKRNNS